MKKILITGGAGFIGSNLALKLIEKGYVITVLDSLSSQVHGINPKTTSPLFLSIQDKVKFIYGSITSKETLLTAIEGQDIIVHFAAETGTGQSMYEIDKYTKVNIGGTALLLDILTNVKTSVRKIIVASSRAIYGEGKYYSEKLGFIYPNGRNEKNLSSGDFEVKYPGCEESPKVYATDEDSKIHPTSIYGITKMVQEEMVMLVTKAIGIAGVSLRYQNVYGPGQSLSNPYTGILSIFSTRIRNGSEINIFEDGLESRDFVYIDDVVRATILAIEKDEANGQVFNVGTGIPVTVNDVVDLLQKYFNKKVPTKISGNYRVGDIRHNYADINKIYSLLGYSAKISFEEGISKFVTWVDQQAPIQDSYDLSITELKEKGLFK